MLEKVLKLADVVERKPLTAEERKQSAAAIRALVEVAECADRIWYDDSEDNKACLAHTIYKLEVLNDGLEV